MIASDDNNPQFVGAHNPDSRLMVRFYEKVLPNEFESKKQGRPVFYSCDFIEINLPGNQLNNVDTFVNETHKQRFPIQWQQYLNNKGADPTIVGTPLSEWPLIGRSAAEELRALKFFTVESIANASDTQLQVIGMRGGMQAFTLRDKAANWLKAAADSAAADKAEARAQEAEKANAANLEMIKQMQEQIAALSANQKGKPGRKPATEPETVD